MIRALAIEAEAETVETEGYAAPAPGVRALPVSRGRVLDDFVAREAEAAEPVVVQAEAAS